MKTLPKLIVLSLFLQSALTLASDSCREVLRALGPADVERETLDSLVRELDVKRHESMNELSPEKSREYLHAFFTDVCKIPSPILSVTQRKGVRFYLTNGPITLSPMMRNKTESTPRNHAPGAWNHLPGAYHPMSKSVIINIASLKSNHGAKSLVLHEYGHAVDYVFSNRIINRKLSASKAFQDAVQDTPWFELYRPSELKEKNGEEEYDKWVESHNKWVETSADVLITYTKAHPEEHFAELFARFHDSEEGAEKIRSLMPDAHEYFDALGEKSQGSGKRFEDQVVDTARDIFERVKEEVEKIEF